MRIRTVHKLKTTDRLEVLSARYRVPVCMIMRANNVQQDEDISSLSELKIPCICYCNHSKKTAPVSYIEYTVQPSDTLYGIARRHGVTMKLLQKANGIKDPLAVFAGDKLKIPQIAGEVYSVREGETLEDIARRSGVCVSRLREINGLEPSDTVFPGMRIVIG